MAYNRAHSAHSFDVAADGRQSAVADRMLAAARASSSCRELVGSQTDSIIEYRAQRRGYDIVSRVNYSLLQRVQRRRQSGPGWQA